jgi:hypothetical protein
MKKEEGKEHTSSKMPGSAGAAVGAWQCAPTQSNEESSRGDSAVMEAASLREGDPKIIPWPSRLGVQRRASNHLGKIIKELTSQAWRKYGEGKDCLRKMQKIARNENLAQGIMKGKRIRRIKIRIEVDLYFHFCKIDGNIIQTEY